MPLVGADLKTMTYIRSEAEFGRAKTQGFWDTVLSLITGQQPHLLSFNRIVKTLDIARSCDLGVQDIPIKDIVGSLGRDLEFTRHFLPRHGHESGKERWRRLYTLATTGGGVPPIQVYKVGQGYFVEDGHHRVSVARYLGWKTIQAQVIELSTPNVDSQGQPALAAEVHRPGLKSESKGDSQSTSPVLRLILYKGELFHLPQIRQEIRVLSGRAWLTVAGKDIILTRGEKMSLTKKKDLALISALGQSPLVVEVWRTDGVYPQKPSVFLFDLPMILPLNR
jgi:hypothetical protein